MAREPVEKDPIKTAIIKRKKEINYIKNMARKILKNPDKIDSIIVAIEAEGETYRDWFGSLNGCYGLTQRVAKNLELHMGDLYDE